MRLYEINKRVEAILAQLEPDPETGEVMADDDVLVELATLQEDREDIIRWLVKEHLNSKSDAEQLKSEAKRLTDRQKAAEARAERLRKLVERETEGEGRKYDFATVSYKKTPEATVWNEDDEAMLKTYLRISHPEFLKVTEEVKKAELKKFLKDGASVPYVTLRSEVKMSIK